MDLIYAPLFEFELYGFAYVGPFEHYLHKLRDNLFKGYEGNEVVAKKVILEQLVLHGTTSSDIMRTFTAKKLFSISGSATDSHHHFFRTVNRSRWHHRSLPNR
ncbi:hypothetical protein P8452_47468 [Trifolium repens]|nr:hypothetical protein P8452_47468 [Trifolium repens]